MRYFFHSDISYLYVKLITNPLSNFTLDDIKHYIYNALRGLNYAHSKQVLTQWLEADYTQILPVSLVLIRIAELSTVARQLGQDAKHTILQAWGQCFQAYGPNQEMTGHWRNGEFILGLSQAMPTDVQDALEPLLQALRRLVITLPTGDRIQPAFD